MNEIETTQKEERSVNVLIAVKIAATIIKWVRADGKNRYGLAKRHVTRIKADGIGLYQFDNGTYKIESPTPNETIITAEPFDPDTGYWDGSSMTWDMSLFDHKVPRKDGLFEASLDHDLTFTFAEEIARANDTTVKEVHTWANRVLQLEMKHYAKISSKVERGIIRRILDFGATRYSAAKKLFGRLFCALAITGAAVAVGGCIGCNWDELDEGEVEADPIEWTRTAEGK